MCLSCHGLEYLIMKDVADKTGRCSKDCHGIVIRTKICIDKHWKYIKNKIFYLFKFVILVIISIYFFISPIYLLFLENIVISILIIFFGFF
jgi:hypothetical protein